jgi:hypothetical protein
MFWLAANVRSASDGVQSGGNRQPFFGEGVTFSFFNSGSGSGECLSNREAFADATLLDFNALARAPAFPDADLFDDFSSAIASSADSLRCVNPPSQGVKNAKTSALILCQRDTVSPAILASFSGLSGKTPSDRHMVISRSRYAPCCSVVRCLVSPR